MFIVQRAGVGAFGTFFTQDPVLLVSQDRVPFAVAVSHFKGFISLCLADQRYVSRQFWQYTDYQGCKPQPAARYENLPP